ncbi:CLUMA_CG020314, isoform A [Clunio marinus]|uniref:CLUMA_CG020314, isoform A n=1 Tax=Clunio marinus TaxID=568069 RepID=A0A1J1J4L9_9DIPT|nr:CLUMA_CG020314, isoform A [Clunio marinus]
MKYANTKERKYSLRVGVAGTQRNKLAMENSEGIKAISLLMRVYFQEDTEERRRKTERNDPEPN